MGRGTWTTQYTELSNSSQFHELLRVIFCEDELFKYFNCYQEVAVKELNPEYPYPHHHYDWYIDEVATVVELHGRQHYHVVNFGSISATQAQQNFKDGQRRDKLKKQAALDAGLKYVEIPYTLRSKLNAELLKQLVLETE